MSQRRYARDVLAGGSPAPTPAAEVFAEPGLRVAHRRSDFVGRVVRVEVRLVVLRADGGGQRVFRLEPGAFRVDGRPATLVRPVGRGGRAGSASRSASGSIRAEPRPARVARASRIWVEGIHDAELLEKVWGDDLRQEGVVVEPLGGADLLADAVRAFAPAPTRRLGVLLDHLVAGSKEQRIADAVASPQVLVTGHPYVDVWEGVRPRALGLSAWPRVPRGQPWKEGVCAALGAGEPAAFWRRVLAAVDSYADLEQPLVGAVERLIDFVATPAEST
jgi:hypothetical protein